MGAPEGLHANTMAASGLVSRSDMVGTGRAISVLFDINGVRNKRSYLVGPLFPSFKANSSAVAGWHFKACFSALAVWHFSSDLSRHLLIGGCGQSHVSLKDN